MGASITLAGESLIAQKQASRQTLEMARFVLANIPGLDTTQPVDRTAGLPQAEQIVYTEAVQYVGYLASNKVVYSLMLGTNLGDFDFNWIGLETAEGTLFIAAYVPLQQKRREIPPSQTGNNLTRNIVWEYDGAQALSGIDVPASTWQFDFSGTFEQIHTELASIRQEMDTKAGLDDVCAPVSVNLDGPLLVYPGSSNSFKITDYNRFSIYTVVTATGTVSIAADTVTLVIPVGAQSGLTQLKVIRDGAESLFNVAIGAASIVSSRITSPISEAANVSLDLTIKTTPFQVYPVGYDRHVSTRYQVATDAEFTALIFDETSTSELESIQLIGYDVLLQAGKRYYVRAFHNGETLSSANPDAVAFNTVSSYIRKPAILSPVDGQSAVSTGVTFTSDAFSVYGGNDTHTHSRFMVSTAADGTGMVQDSGWDDRNLLSFKPASRLPESSKLYVRVKYRGKNLGETEWSVPITFTTGHSLMGTFTQLATGPSPRLDAAGAVLNGKLYVQGGRYNNISGSMRSDLWEFTPANSTWSQKSVNKSLQSHTAVAIGSLIYFLGGSTSSGGSAQVSDLWSYNPVGNVVKALAAFPKGVIHNHVAVEIAGEMYVFGGSVAGSYSNAVYKYTPATNTWKSLGTSPSTLNVASAAVVGKKAYIFNSGSFYCYDSEANTWASKALPDAVSYFYGRELVMIDGLIYAHGGYVSSSYSKQLFKYDPSLDEWEALPSGGIARQGFVFAEINGSAYAFGGSAAGTYMNDFWKID